MVEDSALLTRMGFNYNDCTDKFALMPFLNPGDNNDWARIFPVCYIGLNKKLELSENKKKYNEILKLLEYISTPKGQFALSGDISAMFSSLKDMPAPTDIPEIADLLPALEYGRYSILPTLKNSQDALRTGVAGMVNGTATKEEVIAMADKQNISPPVKMKPLVLGTATENFAIIETGNFVTDAMRESCGVEIALFLDNGKDGLYNGKGISAKIYKGDITSKDIDRIYPDTKQSEKGELWKIRMTGENLIKTLEHSITINNNSSGWFYYFSGLRMSYNPSGEPGKRISKTKDINGNKIDLNKIYPNKIYPIVIMDESVPNEYIISTEKTGNLIKDILQTEIAKKKQISQSNDRRFTITNK